MSSDKKLIAVVRRFIRASPERVYAAWTDPRKLREWFGPENVETEELMAEERVGGKFYWRIRNAEGERMAVRGEYRELRPNQRIVFTWQWEEDEDWENCESVVTVELSEGDSGTYLCLTHENLPNENSREGHEGGWTRTIDELEDFVGRQRSVETGTNK